jgi:hypothetical protein
MTESVSSTFPLSGRCNYTVQPMRGECLIMGQDSWRLPDAAPVDSRTDPRANSECPRGGALPRDVPTQLGSTRCPDVAVHASARPKRKRVHGRVGGIASRMPILRRNSVAVQNGETLETSSQTHTYGDCEGTCHWEVTSCYHRPVCPSLLLAVRTSAPVRAGDE